MADTNNAISRAVRELLEPVVRIILRSGMTFSQFSQLAKTVFVAVAGREFGKRGRPTNVSRVALLTGLTRRDVRRQREILESIDEPGYDKASNIARVLMGWHSDPDFSDGGKPRDLPVNDSEDSFDSLYRRYGGGDVPCTTALKELISSGAVERLDGDRLRARSRAFVPVASDPVALERAGDVMADLGDTVAANLYGDNDRSLFEGRATSRYIPERELHEFREYIEAEGQAFLERVDDWLNQHEKPEEARSRRVGIGIYQISRMDPGGNPGKKKQGES